MSVNNLLKTCLYLLFSVYNAVNKPLQIYRFIFRFAHQADKKHWVAGIRCLLFS